MKYRDTKNNEVLLIESVFLIAVVIGLIWALFLYLSHDDINKSSNTYKKNIVTKKNKNKNKEYIKYHSSDCVASIIKGKYMLVCPKLD